MSTSADSGSARSVAVDRRRRRSDVGDHRPALLRQAGLLQAGGAEAVEVRGHLEDLRDRDDARCRRRRASAATRSPPSRRRGSGSVGGRLRGPGLASLPSRGDQQERRAVALQAGEVLIARGLVDLGLATELRLDGPNRQAGRLLAAVAAALADALVDPDPLRGDRELAALAQPALLGAQRSSWISTVTPSTRRAPPRPPPAVAVDAPRDRRCQLDRRGRSAARAS